MPSPPDVDPRHRHRPRPLHPQRTHRQGHDIAAVVLIFFVGVAIYLPSLRGSFVFDDGRAIEENGNSNFRANTTAEALANIRDMWTKDYWGSPLLDERSHKSFRPITILSFYLNGEACDRIHAWVERGANAHLSESDKMMCWHGPNLMLHGANSVLVFLVSANIFRRIGAEEKYASFAAEFVGVLFAVHPIHVGNQDDSATQPSSTLLAGGEEGSGTDSVAATNAELPARVKKFNGLGVIFRLGLFFVLTIALAFLRWRMAGGKPCSDCFPVEINPPSFQQEWKSRIMSHAFVHFKSFVIALFPADLCCDWGSRCIKLVESISDPRNLITVGFAALVILPSLCIALLACLKTVRSQMFYTPRQSKAAVVSGGKAGSAAAVATATSGPGQGTSIPEEKNSTATRKLRTLRVGETFAFGLAFISLTFLPASNLFVRVGFTIAERVHYAPSAGLALLVGLGLLYQLHKIGIDFSAQGALTGNRAKILIKTVIGILFVAMALKTSLRSVDWTTSYDLFSSSLLVCPNNARLHTFLGRTLIDTGAKLGEQALFPVHDSEQMVTVPQLTMDILEDIDRLKRNSSYLDSGLIDDGIPRWSPSAQHWERRYTYRNVSADFDEWVKNITRRDHFHRHKSFLVAAEGHFVRSIEIGRDAGIDEQSYNDLGRAQAYMREFLEALKNFEIAVKYNRLYSHPRENVRVCLRHIGTSGMLNNYDRRATYEFQNVGNFLEAEILWKNALTLAPDRGSLLNNLALAIMRQGRYNEAEKYYLHALEKDPSFEGTQPSLERLRQERARIQGLPNKSVHGVSADQKASDQS